MTLAVHSHAEALQALERVRAMAVDRIDPAALEQIDQVESWIMDTLGGPVRVIGLDDHPDEHLYGEHPPLGPANTRRRPGPQRTTQPYRPR